MGDIIILASKEFHDNRVNDNIVQNPSNNKSIILITCSVNIYLFFYIMGIAIYGYWNPSFKTSILNRNSIYIFNMKKIIRLSSFVMNVLVVKEKSKYSFLILKIYFKALPTIRGVPSIVNMLYKLLDIWHYSYKPSQDLWKAAL